MNKLYHPSWNTCQFTFSFVWNIWNLCHILKNTYEFAKQLLLDKKRCIGIVNHQLGCFIFIKNRLTQSIVYSVNLVLILQKPYIFFNY